MSVWAGFAWCGIYILMVVVIPSKKKGNGYITRWLRKWMRPRFLWESPRDAFHSRYMYWLIITLGPLLASVIRSDVYRLIFWPVVIGLCLDDYLNGDDELKKKLHELVNKVKWLWTPQMEPARDWGI